MSEQATGPVLQFEEPEPAEDTSVADEVPIASLRRTSRAKVLVTLQRGRLVRLCVWQADDRDKQARGAVLTLDEVPYVIAALRDALEAAIAAGWTPPSRNHGHVHPQGGSTDAKSPVHP